MARIPYATPETMSTEIRAVLAGRRQINIFRMLANSENVGPGVLALGRKMSIESSLPPAEREVVILRVAQLSNCPFMKHEHTAVSRRHKLSDSWIDAVAQYPADSSLAVLSDFEQLLVRFVDDVVINSNASDEHFDAMAEHYDNSVLVELVLLIGFYMMIGRAMNTFDIELQDGPVDVFPESWAL
jgi:AhpD family alkylhydroperoxidase